MTEQDRLEENTEQNIPAAVEPQAADVPVQQRLRIIFGKHGSQKYIGHLDLAKTWERILRRAEIGLAYSQGFNARPKIQIATALPLGITSDCEILDMWLTSPTPLEGLAENLTRVSPPGLPIFKIEEVPLKSPAVQTILESSIYILTPLDTIDLADLRARVENLMAQSEIIRKRKDKHYNLRPLIRALSIDEDGRIHTELVLSNEGTGRTDELLDALGLKDVGVSVHRAELKLKS